MGRMRPQRRDVADVGEQRLGLEDEKKWRNDVALGHPLSTTKEAEVEPLKGCEPQGANRIPYRITQSKGNACLHRVQIV